MGWLDVLTGKQTGDADLLPMSEEARIALSGGWPGVEKMPPGLLYQILSSALQTAKVPPKGSAYGSEPLPFTPQVWGTELPPTGSAYSNIPPQVAQFLAQNLPSTKGPLEAPKAHTPMPKIPKLEAQAGTTPTYGGTPQRERPGVSAQMAGDYLDYAQRHPELIGGPQPEIQLPTQAPVQAPAQLPPQADMQIPSPPERPDFAGRLRGITEAMPRTTADILPRPMAPKFKNIWLEAIRYALPAAVGKDPGKVEAERQRPLDEQWLRDLGVATARLDAKTQAEVKILGQEMLDYNTANADYRVLLTELGNRYPGLEKNPNFLSSLMRTYHMTEKAAKEFIASRTREDGTVDLGLSKKEQKVQEIKTQVEILEEFMPGIPKEILVEKALGGGFTRTVAQIEGSLAAIIIDEKMPIAKREEAQKQLEYLRKSMKETEVDQLDKDMKALDKLKPYISKEEYNMLAASTIKYRFHVPEPKEPKEEKGDKALEEQRRFQHTQTTTGTMGVFFSANPGYLKDTTGEATRAKMEEWDTATQKYTNGRKQLEVMSKGKQLNPAQIEAFWKKTLTPKEFGMLEEIKIGSKKYVMTDMTTGKARVDQNGRPRTEIIATTGGNLTVEQWNWLIFLVDQKDAAGRPSLSNQKILEMLSK